MTLDSPCSSGKRMSALWVRLPLEKLLDRGLWKPMNGGSYSESEFSGTTERDICAVRSVTDCVNTSINFRSKDSELHHPPLL
jgi:hypothetical protein